MPGKEASVQQKSRSFDPASLTHDRLRTNSNRIDITNIPEAGFPACHQLWGQPASMCDAVFYGTIQGRTISTGWTARDDFQRLQVQGFRFNAASRSSGSSSPVMREKLKKPEAISIQITPTQIVASHLSMRAA
jgi:hypothetical protein